MQNYFSLLSLDHLARQFELFWLCGFLKRFSKIFPIETDVEIFYPIVAPMTPGDHAVNKIDSALYQEALL
jgi:hypothetical protein